MDNDIKFDDLSKEEQELISHFEIEPMSIDIKTEELYTLTAAGRKPFKKKSAENHSKKYYLHKSI